MAGHSHHLKIAVKRDVEDREKVRASVQGSNSDNDESSSSNYNLVRDPYPLPSEANKWTKQNLQDLKIRIDESNASPVDIVKMVFPSNRTKDHNALRKKLSRLDDFVHEMTDAIEGTTAYQLLDYSFDSLSKGRGIIDWFATRSDMWNISSNFQDDIKLTEFKQL